MERAGGEGFGGLASECTKCSRWIVYIGLSAQSALAEDSAECGENARRHGWGEGTREETKTCVRGR